MDEWKTLGPPSEELRKRLLQQELKLRKKQPEHWAKTKYRKYAERQTKKAQEAMQPKEDNKKSKKTSR